MQERALMRLSKAEAEAALNAMEDRRKARSMAFLYESKTGVILDISDRASTAPPSSTGPAPAAQQFESVGVQPNGAGAIAWGLIIAGVILAVYAFFIFDVSAGETYGREIANLERIASRTMMMIAGVGAVVSGSILYVGDKIYVELTRPR